MDSIFDDDSIFIRSRVWFCSIFALTYLTGREWARTTCQRAVAKDANWALYGTVDTVRYGTSNNCAVSEDE